MNAYHGSLRLQENVAQQRIRFAQRLNEMSDELLGLAREGEKLRKLVSDPGSTRRSSELTAGQHKENGTRYQTILQESESAMEKVSASSYISELFTDVP